MNSILALKDISKIEPFELIIKAGITKAPVDVFALANSLDIVVDTSFSVEKDLSLAGEIYIDKENVKPVIWVNPLDYKTRQRFTMAHEIAHLVNDIIPNLNHPDTIEPFLDSVNSLKRDGSQDPREFRANEFAAQLLMPVDFIIDEATKIIANYKKENGEGAKLLKDELSSQLATIFEVSKQAMTIRLSRLL
ncbi:MAG: ImmA/IrrE family metallo-endopeptidase [Methylococcales bacterium]|nr:ImmA/IrrE family metallo-endopeptidase [Methylococcales bacterium]MDD5755636.1 ImmA/IrrE family metallo-endopeptidase [Methylococcales bacterium]